MPISFPELSKDIAAAAMLEKPGGYIFRKYSVGEESSLFRAAVTEEVCSWAGLNDDFKRSDLLAGIEPGGLPWALLFGFLHRKSVLPIRSDNSKLQGLDASSTGVKNLYSQKTLLLEMSGNGEQVGLVDDIVSSGETLLQAAKLIVGRGFSLASISVILARDLDRLARIEDQLGLKINVMCHDQAGSANAHNVG